MVKIKKEKIRRPCVGLAIILMKENKVLLGKRKGDHGGGLWALPGGHLEFYEEFEDCAIREIKEETGLTAENFDLVDYKPVAITNDFFLFI